LLANLLCRGGPLLASALVLSAAVASLFGPEPVQGLVGSAWFVAASAVILPASLLAAVSAAAHRALPSAVQHLGLVVALVGVAVNQRAARSGYIFLEQGGGASNFALSRDLRRVEALPRPLALDSLTSISARAFQTAPVAWVTAADGPSRPVTYNRPMAVAGRQVLVSSIAAPGFLTEYEISLDEDEYLLLHNQVIAPSPDLRIWSFAYDTEAGSVGLMLGKEQRWLAMGESATVAGRTLKLVSATFADGVGAIFVVNDVRYRSIIFLGFELVLLGLLPPLFRKENQ
jgi:hypothetical protein